MTEHLPTRGLCSTTQPPRITSSPSPHQAPRPAEVGVDTVVLHATCLPTLAEVIAHFQDPATKVSAHYTIDRDGSTVQHVPEEHCAWHAGVSQMPDGRKRVNEFSIGIELVNRNDGDDPYPDAQLEALQGLLRDISRRHPIRQIVSHAEIAQPRGRKDDPRGLDLDLLRLLILCEK